MRDQADDDPRIEREEDRRSGHWDDPDEADYQADREADLRQRSWWGDHDA